MAEILEIFHSYVGYLEKGTRKASKSMLKKFADFFQVSVDELIALQLQVVDTSKEVLPTDGVKSEQKMQELTDLLMKLNEEIRISLIHQFKDQAQQALYNLLTPYDVAYKKICKQGNA